MKNKAQREFMHGVWSIGPLAVGVGAYGLAFGLLTSQAGFSWTETGVMGALVFAGSSQIIAVERLAADAGLTIALIAGMVLNLRLLLITASLRDLFLGRPLWQRMIGVHLSSDENWALTLARRSQGHSVGYWFLVGSGLTLVLVWVSSGILGVLFAKYIPNPRDFGIDFVFTAAFIAIASSLWRGHSDIGPWIAAIGIVIVAIRLELFDSSWAIILGGLTGASVAALRDDD